MLQQVHYQLYSGSPMLILLTVAGIGALAWFAYHQWHHPTPLVRLHAFRERTFQVGLLLYMFYYYESTGFSYLTSRFLESAGYPVENAGRLVGTMSLISATALFAYLRYAKFVTHKKWFVVPGFAIAITAALWMTRMTPQVGEAALIVPLLLRGLLLLFIVLPVANLTFRIFAIDEYTHGYRLKNIVRQLTISFATSSVIIVEQHRVAVHQTRLVERANVFDPLFQQTVDALTHSYAAAGHALSEAHGLAIASIARMVAQQASFLASLDGFYFLAGVALVGGLFAAWQKRSIELKDRLWISASRLHALETDPLVRRPPPRPRAAQPPDSRRAVAGHRRAPAVPRSTAARRARPAARTDEPVRREEIVLDRARAELTDAMIVSIAAQACLPVLNLDLSLYDGWVGVVVSGRIRDPQDGAGRGRGRARSRAGRKRRGLGGRPRDPVLGRRADDGRPRRVQRRDPRVRAQDRHGQRRGRWLSAPISPLARAAPRCADLADVFEHAYDQFCARVDAVPDPCGRASSGTR